MKCDMAKEVEVKKITEADSDTQEFAESIDQGWQWPIPMFYLIKASRRVIMCPSYKII